ncbi:uncharacterized protein LOC116302761 [Actinia tenebrosa]|uniref:Uncharacterized protein LOC116302761 n=1 Tax=Actinia tenebrosa TaxID=6105 RepID=A0A6P8IN74_ACTTE|nr:uncharacterized protein LOC116302761 [Actinia tenebrosa]
MAEALSEAAAMNAEEYITTVPVPDSNLVGFVIGRSGRTIHRLMKDTTTDIRYENQTNTFIIEGEAENRYAAKLKIKEIISNGLKTQTEDYKECRRFPFVHSNGSGFVLQPVDADYKVKLKDSFNKDQSSYSTDCASFSSQMIKVLESIHKESGQKEDVIHNIWSHFGHIYLSNVNHDEIATEFDAQELLSHVKWENTSNATKWRTKFVGGIVDELESHNLIGWMTNQTEKGIPFIRYEFVYFTPSCRVIRVKIFLAIDATTNAVTYRNIPKSEPLANVIKSSDTEPYFYLCGSTVKRAIVDVFQPAEELDFRFIIDSGSKFQEQVEDKEVDALFNFIRDNMKVKPNHGLELFQENPPTDFDLCYIRVSERRTYPFTSKDDEQFTVKLSYEHIENKPTSTSKTTVDIHLQHDEWDRMLEDGSWTPQKIVDKIPQFMRCASILARTLKVPDTTPGEILARGPKAQEAYDLALKSGEAKYCRIPVVLVGQSGAGKTSLLRSLRREDFNPEEDSTEGVRLHRSLSKAEADVWHEDDTFESSLVDYTARAVAENLSASFDDNPKLELRSTEEDVEEEPLRQAAFEEEDETVGSLVEENNKSLGVEEKTIENDSEIAVGDESVDKKTSTSSDPVLFQESRKDNPIPEEVSERATNILQHPEKLEIQDWVHLVTLDFAGQPVYNATHPVFLPKKAIYVLVNSLKNEMHAKATPMVKHGSSNRKVDDHCPMTNMDYLEFWLSFVASLWTTDREVTDDNVLELLQKGKKASNMTEQKSTTKKPKLPRRLPPVFLVCTHADIPCKGNDAVEMTREIFSYLKQDNDTPGGNHIVRGIYAINNTVSGKSEEKSIDDLRAAIYEVARSLPYVNEVVPISWLQFEKQLLDLATNENKKYISLDEAKAVAVQCQIAINTEDQFNTVLNYLHDLKVIIHFEDTNIVIIDVQWLMDMIVKIITVLPAEDWEDEYEEQWRRLENDGILEQALINHVWENETTASSLLMIMEKFSLLCRWKRSNDADIFLVPSMLMNSDAKSANELLSDQKTSRTLVVRFKSAHLPLGIFPRLLVVIAKTCNEKWPHSPRPKFFHNFCRFYDVGDVGDTGKSFDLVVTSDIKTISFSVINEQGIVGLPLKQLCRFIVEFLSKALATMRLNFPWMKNAEHEFCIRCPKCYPSTETCKCHNVSGCTRDACLHFITEDELRKKQPRCYRNATSKSTFFKEEIYCDWFDISRQDDRENVTNSNTANVVTETIQLLALDGLPSTSKGSEIVPYPVQSHEVSLPESTPLTIAQFKKLLEDLKPYKTSMKNAPPEMVKSCRDICQKLKGVHRKSSIEELRKHVPSGTTGPLEEENKSYEQLDAEKKQNLTRACGRAILKKLLWEFGKSNTSEYYEGQMNPVEVLLEEERKKQTLTFGQLYNVLVKCEAAALADEYL